MKMDPNLGHDLKAIISIIQGKCFYWILFTFDLTLQGAVHVRVPKDSRTRFT